MAVNSCPPRLARGFNGGPFWREASPKQPIRLDELPDPHRRLIQRVTVKGCFRWLWRLRPSRFEF